jgi:hypothetical protein
MPTDRTLVFWYQTLDIQGRLVVKWKWADDGLCEREAQIPEGATTKELQQWFEQHFGDDVLLDDDRQIDVRCKLETPKNGAWYLAGPNPDRLSGRDLDFRRMSEALLKARTESDDLKKRLRETCQILVEEIGAAGPTSAEDMARRMVAHASALRKELSSVRSQLPEGAENCTIRFIQCEKGHGRLTATNWIDNGCPHCALDAAREANDRKNVAIKKMADELRPITFHLEQDLSVSPHWRVRWRQQNGGVGAFECICLACPEKDKELARRLKEIAELQYGCREAIRALGGSVPGEDDDEDYDD